MHKDVSQRLKVVSPLLYERCRKVLDTNKSQRHIRGGLATREKYADIRQRKKQVAAR
ncbi:MAG: sporulation transcriptional regulator SpoIIID [Oscillospiraceae bacterium]|nr:sporulation transcriptional regulator SpoIIID [Oscillospiraceae bacterium]MBP1556377.1 sporulation transcriptional regulator SpoIIID [Oscillospiraceae bacterium]